MEPPPPLQERKIPVRIRRKRNDSVDSVTFLANL